MYIQNIMRLMLLSSLFLYIFGCGGGGSSQNLTPINTAGATGSSSLSIAKTALAQSDNTTVTATFTKTDGTPSSGVIVSFTTTLGTISPATTTTDSQGKATATLLAGTTSGQGQVAASATYDGKTYVKTGNFQISLPVLHLSSITLGAATATLSYGGTTSVSVQVLDAANAVYTAQEVDVYFSSTAVGSGTATITSPVRTVNGIATTTYKGLTFTGTDTITATITGSSSTKTLSITPLSAGSITYVSATPTNLALKGSGGIGKSEVSTVVFKVLDSSGAARPNTTVDFSLNTSIGGISLSASSGSTGSDGTVVTQVNSGVISTSVRVTAAVRDTNISTQSEQLVVSTGLPSQDGFSIAISTLNPEAWSIDGVVDVVTARLSDHFHNPVPDGTAVYFTTSGGSIQPSCTTVGGACSVNWISQNPRPMNGRAVILAYAVGEESFLDLDGNGVADAGEFTDTSEAFRDDNENGVRDAAETFIDFNRDGVFNGPDGKYNGVLQGAAYIGAPKSKHVFSNSTLVMSGSAAQIINSCGNSITVAFGGSTACAITVKDVNSNTMPAGTKVEFVYTSIVTGITLTSDTFTFPNSTSNSGAVIGVLLADAGVAPNPVGRGSLKVTVTSPGGLISIKNYIVN